jgi:thiamine biosynthesis lipoprotein
MPAAELAFHAMGGQAHLLVIGGRHLLDEGRRLVEALEARWSRFRPDSDVARLNRAGGAPVRVTPETLLIMSLVVDGWKLTAGRFDPTVVRALEANGYDRTFAEVVRGRGGPVVAVPAPGLQCVVHDVAGGTVTMPPDVGIDLGGVGKGAAADLVVLELLAAGARGVCLNLGGDLRVSGQAPQPGGWVVAVEDPFRPERELARIAIGDGAVATSSRLVRTWQRGEGSYHHLIDPRSGLPCDNGLAAVTVVAGCAWWAEVLATATMVAGAADGARLLAAHDVTGMLVDDLGRERTLPGFRELMV